MIKRSVSGFRWLTCSLGICALASMGCGSSTGELQGVVRYKNERIRRGTVVVFAEDGRIFSGLIQQDGRYSISGVPCGRVRLTLTTHPPVPRGFNKVYPMPPSTAPILTAYRLERGYPSADYIVLPERYRDPDQSGLECEVVPGSTRFDVTLTP